MQCPVCNVALVMSDRNGIEIDYCPQCRGVWLDRGELDKIIDRSASGHQAPQPQQSQYHQQPQRDNDDDDDDRYRPDSHHDGRHSERHEQHGHKKKKEGFLGDLFDF